MTYAGELGLISRTPCTVAVLTIDTCSRTFGTGACTATGTKCYNTYPTCKDKTNYDRTTKTFKFSSADAPLPFSEGERPYITKIDMYPTEIKKDNLTTKARVKVYLHDEDDTDVGIDPYLADRSSVQGTFWKKFLARNPNFRGRTIQVYEGFVGLAFGSYVEKFSGLIENITLSKGQVLIEGNDILKGLADITIPPALDIKSINALGTTETTITLSDVSDLDSAGYVRIDDEVISYTSKDAPTNRILGCTRGAWGTAAATHSADAKVGKCQYYAAQNPFDILTGMLSGLPVNTASFTDAKAWPGGEINFRGLITEPTPLEDLVFELIEILDCRLWVAEDLQITIARNVPNRGGRTYTVITDEANVIEGSADLNDKSRITRVLFYWGKDATGDLEKPASYSRLDIAIDANAESANEYGDEIAKTFWCRWIDTTCASEEILATWIRALTGRYLLNRRDASPLVTVAVERKDSDLKTGDYVRLSTDELQNADGTDLERATFQVVKREVKGGQINYTLERLPRRRACIIAPEGTPVYASATEAQREYGFITDEFGKMENGDDGYYIF